MLRWIIMALGVAAAAWARRAVRHAIVTGPSMLPTLAPGDRLVLVRSVGRLRSGQLATVSDPRVPQRTLLKRVRAVVGDAVDVRGDNEAASTDSRTFGMVSASAVDGWVAWRYAPLGRAGLVAAPTRGVSASRAVPDRRRSRRPVRR